MSNLIQYTYGHPCVCLWYVNRRAHPRPAGGEPRRPQGTDRVARPSSPSLPSLPPSQRSTHRWLAPAQEAAAPATPRLRPRPTPTPKSPRPRSRPLVGWLVDRAPRASEDLRSLPSLPSLHCHPSLAVAGRGRRQLREHQVLAVEVLIEEAFYRAVFHRKALGRIEVPQQEKPRSLHPPILPPALKRLLIQRRTPPLFLIIPPHKSPGQWNK